MSRPGSTRLPKITVITPSFNQGEFLEDTLRSVLEQNYEALEYIVVDGGSTDASVSIIRRYEHKLAWWVSEPDHGQSHAINKGFERASGEIICWLNSDDCLAPGALDAIAKTLASPGPPHAAVGHCVRVFVDTEKTRLERGLSMRPDQMLAYWHRYTLHQPSIFWRREVFEQIGGLREDLHLIMDFDYWYRIAKKFEFIDLDLVLSYSKYHSNAKTSDNFLRYTIERQTYALKNWAQLPVLKRASLEIRRARHWLTHYLRTIASKLRALI